MSIFENILKAYHRNRMPHALLIAGIDKQQKQDFIDKLSALLLCSLPQEKGACGQCQGCQWFLKGNHPDYYSYGEVEAISIEKVREIQSVLEKTSHQGRYQVVLLHQVDNLSVYTANALLKCLEEPPRQTVWLLTVENRQKVLSTIQSRCVPIYLSSLKKNVISEVKEHQEFKELIFWGTHSPFNQESIFEKIVAETVETLYLFYYWVAEFCLYGVTKNTGYLSMPLEKARYDSLLKSLSVEKAIKFQECILKSIQQSSLTGLNKGLLWSSLVIKWEQLKMENR